MQSDRKTVLSALPNEESTNVVAFLALLGEATIVVFSFKGLMLILILYGSGNIILHKPQ